MVTHTYEAWMAKKEVALAIKAFELYFSGNFGDSVYKHALEKGISSTEISNFKKAALPVPRSEKAKQARLVLVNICLDLCHTHLVTDMLTEARRVLENTAPKNHNEKELDAINNSFANAIELLHRKYRINILNELKDLRALEKNNISDAISGIYQGFRLATNPRKIEYDKNKDDAGKQIILYTLRINEFDSKMLLPTFDMIYNHGPGQREIFGVVIRTNDLLVFLGSEKRRNYSVYFVWNLHEGGYDLDDPIFGLHLVMNLEEVPISARTVFYRRSNEPGSENLETSPSAPNAALITQSDFFELDALPEDPETILKHIDNSLDNVLTIKPR